MESKSLVRSSLLIKNLLVTCWHHHLFFFFYLIWKGSIRFRNGDNFSQTNWLEILSFFQLIIKDGWYFVILLHFSSKVVFSSPNLLLLLLYIYIERE